MVDMGHTNLIPNTLNETATFQEGVMFCFEVIGIYINPVVTEAQLCIDPSSKASPSLAHATRTTPVKG